MHEVSIATSLLEIAIDNCLSQGFKQIDNIKVLVGKASGVLPDALIFAFDVIKKETLASTSVLTIEEVAVSGYCNTCGKDFIAEGNYVLCCPHCNGISYTLKTGRELNISEMEVF